MRTITLQSGKFDLEGFVDSLFAFNREVFGAGLGEENDDSPDVLLAILDENEEDGLYWPREHGDHNIKPKQLLAEGKTVFFPFHDGCDGKIGEPIRCADGKVIVAPDETDEDGNLNPDWDEKYESLPNEGNVCGFLVTTEDGTTRIESVFTIGGTCTEPPHPLRECDCGLLDEGLEAYVRRFVRE